uniref:Uncharacterized protein n=1 Tax=Noccaea caerulescens TaxID=107243 RepID=A0A1J3FV55_NOCCA
MKPVTMRTATARRRINDEDGGCSPFNMSCLKHVIDAVDAAKERTNNLSSLAVALSAASRKMKQTEKSERKRVRESRRKKKKLLIGAKPETQAELQRWFSNLDESFRRSLMENNCNVAYKVTPKTLMEPQICGFNTDFTMNHCSEAFF